MIAQMFIHFLKNNGVRTMKMILKNKQQIGMEPNNKKRLKIGPMCMEYKISNIIEQE